MKSFKITIGAESFTLTEEQLSINPALTGASKRRAILRCVSRVIHTLDISHRFPNGDLNPTWYSLNTALYNHLTAKYQ